MTYQKLEIYSSISNFLGISIRSTIILLAVIGIWSLAWKGIALWKSSQKKQLTWFIILLIINTMGILEILYIFIFSKIKLDNRKKRTNLIKTKSIKKSKKSNKTKRSKKK